MQFSNIHISHFATSKRIKQTYQSSNTKSSSPSPSSTPKFEEDIKTISKLTGRDILYSDNTGKKIPMHTFRQFPFTLDYHFYDCVSIQTENFPYTEEISIVVVSFYITFFLASKSFSVLFNRSRAHSEWKPIISNVILHGRPSQKCAACGFLPFE